MLQARIRPALTYFYWSDVSAAIAKEMGCEWQDFHHTFLEWMEENDPEASSDSYGTSHNIDKQIEDLEAKIRLDVETSGEYDDLEGDELQAVIDDTYYGMPFLKAMKKVLGEHSTAATFYYSW